MLRKLIFKEFLKGPIQKIHIPLSSSFIALVLTSFSKLTVHPIPAPPWTFVKTDCNSLFNWVFNWFINRFLIDLELSNPNNYVGGYRLSTPHTPPTHTPGIMYDHLEIQGRSLGFCPNCFEGGGHLGLSENQGGSPFWVLDPKHRKHRRITNRIDLDYKYWFKLNQIKSHSKM